MSDPLRIGAAIEGPTDEIILRAALDCILTDVEYVFVTVQPEGSAALVRTSLIRLVATFRASSLVRPRTAPRTLYEQ